MHSPSIVAVAFAVGLAACGTVEEFTGTFELRRDLEAEYGETEITLFLGNGVRRLELSLDGPMFRGLPDTAVRGKAREVARFAVGHYSRSDQLDTVSVRFVLEQRKILVYSSTRWVSTSFGVADLR